MSSVRVAKLLPRLLKKMSSSSGRKAVAKVASKQLVKEAGSISGLVAQGNILSDILGIDKYGDGIDTADLFDLGGDLAGTALGAVVGQALIPIPGVGAAIGGMAGGWLGGKAGRGVAEFNAPARDSSGNPTSRLYKPFEYTPIGDTSLPSSSYSATMEENDNDTSDYTLSDSRMKYINGIGLVGKLRSGTLSDEEYKDIETNANPMSVARALLAYGPPYAPHELKFLHKLMEEQDDYKPFEYNHKDALGWRDDILDKYGEYIYNYYYKYKPEAELIDPSIDPREEQIGPMAQDVQKVNPAAVGETKEGALTIKDGKLALMNAGAIAELKRELDKVKESIGGGK